MPEKPRLGYGEMRDKLTPDDVEGKAAPLTIQTVDVKNMAPRGSPREDNKLSIVFKEFPGKEYVANATSYKTLCLKLGDNYEKWVGQVAIMAPTTNTFQGKAFEKVHVASPDRWDKVMKSLTKTTAKRGRRNGNRHAARNPRHANRQRRWRRSRSDANACWNPLHRSCRRPMTTSRSSSRRGFSSR